MVLALDLIFSNNSAKRTATQSFNRDIVVCFGGLLLFFAHKNWTDLLTNQWKHVNSSTICVLGASAELNNRNFNANLKMNKLGIFSSWRVWICYLILNELVKRSSEVVSSHPICNYQLLSRIMYVTINDHTGSEYCFFFSYRSLLRITFEEERERVTFRVPVEFSWLVSA